MKSVKFRGWNAETKTMLPPQDLTQSGKYWTWLGEVDVQLMQYTGLKDKNGVEIYEGDIYTVWSELNGENVGQYVVEWTRAGFGPLPDEQYIQVIGNIYENQDLLKDAA